jgi:hypothetical protein
VAHDKLQMRQVSPGITMYLGKAESLEKQP